MVDIVTNEHYSLVSKQFENTLRKINIISPFLSKNTADLMVKAAKSGVKCTFITRFYTQDFLDGSNTLDGLQDMLSAGVEIYAVVGLHTKLYLFDDDKAIVGSANFTNGGLLYNVELSLYLEDEEDTCSKLQAYYEDLLGQLYSSDDALVTQKWLDEEKIKYQKHKEKKKSMGGKSFVTSVRGATLDSKAKRIKSDPNEFVKEIEAHTKERADDVVYSALGGQAKEVSYKTAKNILLKFSASAKSRHDGNKPMVMDTFLEDGKRIYTSHFSLARKSKAQDIQENDETYFCVHSYDMNGKACPMIVGHGYFRRFNVNNDARKKDWYNDYDWLQEYPIYCVIDEATIIKAPVKCGIPLRDLTDALGYKTYVHTIDYPEKYSKETVANSHGQQAMLSLTPEAKEYLDKRLEELEEKYGVNTYKSE